MDSEGCQDVDLAVSKSADQTSLLSMSKLLSLANAADAVEDEDCSSKPPSGDMQDGEGNPTQATSPATAPSANSPCSHHKPQAAEVPAGKAGKKRAAPASATKTKKPRLRSKASNTGQAERQRRQLRLLTAELETKQLQYRQYQLNVNYLKQKERMLDRFLAVHNAQPSWFRIRQAQAELRWQCAASRHSYNYSHLRYHGYGFPSHVQFTKQTMLEQDLQSIASKWREVVPQLSRVLNQLDAQPGQPLLKAELTRHMFDLFNSVLTIIIEPDMWVRFLTTNMETGQQGVPGRGLWERIVENMQVTSEQRYKAFLARDIYLSQMHAIMAEREELLQNSLVEGSRGTGVGLGTAVPGCIATLLGENLMHQHHVSLVFATVAAMELMDSVQYARAYVQCYPWVPDTLAIVDVMASGLDEAGVMAALASAEKPLSPDNSSDERVHQMWSMMQDPIAYDERYQRTRLLKVEV